MIYLEVSYLKAMFGDCAQEQSSGTAQAAQGCIDHTRYTSYWVYRQIGLFAVLQIFVLLLLGLLSSSFGLSGCSVGGWLRSHRIWRVDSCAISDWSPGHRSEASQGYGRILIMSHWICGYCEYHPWDSFDIPILAFGDTELGKFRILESLDAKSFHLEIERGRCRGWFRWGGWALSCHSHFPEHLWHRQSSQQLHLMKSCSSQVLYSLPKSNKDEVDSLWGWLQQRVQLCLAETIWASAASCQRCGACFQCAKGSRHGVDIEQNIRTPSCSPINYSMGSWIYPFHCHYRFRNSLFSSLCFGCLAGASQCSPHASFCSILICSAILICCYLGLRARSSLLWWAPLTSLQCSSSWPTSKYCCFYLASPSFSSWSAQDLIQLKPTPPWWQLGCLWFLRNSWPVPSYPLLLILSMVVLVATISWSLSAVFLPRSPLTYSHSSLPQYVLLSPFKHLSRCSSEPTSQAIA